MPDPAELIDQAFILAANGGPEFGPLTQGVAKAALPFLGAPLLAHVVRGLERQGLRRLDVALCAQPLELEAHFAAHPPAQAQLRFLLERQPLGTAESVRRWMSERPRGGGPALVLMGDLLSEIDLAALLAFHRARGSVATLALVPSDRAGVSGRARVAPDGRLIDFAEGVADANRRVNAGVYVLEAAALGRVLGPDDDLARDLFPRLLEEGAAVYGYETDAYWVDAGHPHGYMRALADALSGRLPGVRPDGEERSPGVWVAPGARVHPKAKLVAPAYVGAAAELAQEAQLGPCAAAEGPSRLERGAQLSYGVAFPQARLGRASRWTHALCYPDGHVDCVSAEARVVPSDDPAHLGHLYAEPLAERLHTALDQGIAALGLLALAPCLLLLALAIKLDSPGPAFYTQLRVGQDRRPYRRGAARGEVFEVFKFRTMRVDADQLVAALRAQNQYGDGGAFFKLERDPRITRVGHFLRRTSLDELPQLINVLKGEMRLVGNRPLPVYEAEALRESWQRARFLAPAGITGLWQISGRSELSENERLALDAYYSVSRTFRRDWGILLRTLPALLMRRGAR